MMILINYHDDYDDGHDDDDYESGVFCFLGFFCFAFVVVLIVVFVLLLLNSFKDVDVTSFYCC